MAALPLVAGRSTHVSNKSVRPIRLDELLHTVFRINTCLLNRVLPNGATTVNHRFSNLGGFCVGKRTLTAPTHHSSRSPDAFLTTLLTMAHVGLCPRIHLMTNCA